YGTLLGRDPGVTLLVCLTGLKLLELANLRDYVLSAFLLFVIILGTFLYTQSLAIGIYAFLAVGMNVAALLRLSRAAALPLAHTVRLTTMLIAQALPVMLVLYLLFPRLSGALWGVQLSAPGGLTGMSEIMQPGSVQSLSESTETAFRVNFEGAPPAAALLYWRGRVLWDTDGRAWYPGPPLSRFEEFSFTPLGPPLAYQVTLEPQANPWLY